MSADGTRVELVRESPEVTQLRITGRLDTPGIDAVEPRFHALLARGHGIVDLSGVTFLASLGIRMLITAAKRLDKRGNKLVLVAPRALVDQALKHSSIDDIIPVAADVEAALALLGP